MHRLANVGLKGFDWLPVQFELDLEHIDDTTTVVTRAIRHVSSRLEKILHALISRENLQSSSFILWIE